MPHASVVRRERDRRQVQTLNWARETFGEAKATDPKVRALRFIEEAVELAQTQGLSKAEINKVVREVLVRPVGEPAQEIGGVMLSLMALASNLDLSVDGCEFEELHRVLHTDPDVFRGREADKTARGLT